MAVSQISLAAPPDIHLHSMTFRRRMQSFIALMLLVLHVQCNSPPKLGTYSQQLLVPENTPIGTIIGNITASDADGQELIFKTDTIETAQLVNLSNPRNVPNQPNTKIVDIILNAVLDRDYAPNERKLYCIVTDGSSSIPIWMTMFIEDVNDVAPKFVNLPYEVTIKENTVVGSIIYSQISAKDPDSGREPSYSMESNAQAADEEYLKTFKIDQYNGNVSLVKQLDYEKHSYYQYKIMAEDEGHLKADPAGFVVYVLDVQDTPPTFVNLPYSVQINEDTPVDQSIQKVVAVDGDRGIPNNITYSFESGDYENFNLNPSTGVITIKNKLDRDSETMKNTGGVYAMTVKASEVVPPDQENYGATTATTLVTITVRDVNDNGPTFSQATYIATIPENMQQGVPVSIQGSGMVVSDIDQGINSHFSITFMKDGLPYYDFSPQPQEVYSEASVLIRVNNSEVLDYEKSNSTVFQVVARELDTKEKRSSTAIVTIKIEDMNDNAPVFSQTEYTLEIAENTPVGTSVAQFSATDLDSEVYGTVTYSLRGGNGKFSIENTTGVLRVAANIDREETEELYLTVEAKDGGGLHTPVEVMVMVQDVNDNKPVFRRDDYEGIVREETRIFLKPLKVEAFDYDKANTNNSNILYRIASTPPGLSSNFSINQTTGEITITEPLDYEKLDPALNGVLTLTVEAYNVGDPNMSSKVLVNITVEDTNDFAPVFQQSMYSVSIPENSKEGYVVCTVHANDSDATSPNNYLIYRIESGALDKFRINFQTGEVEVDKGADLDRESRAEYTLNISAIDRGTPPLNGTCILKINLIDVNDEKPVFDRVSQMVEIGENTAKDSSVSNFSATDPDLNSQLEYSIGKITAFRSDKVDDPINVTLTGVEKYFGINSSTGQIFVLNNLDRETAVKIILEVIVHDKMADVRFGEQTATGTLTVRILDYNDNKPEFIPSSIYKVNVSEADTTQPIILHVVTTDADEGQTVSYSIGASTVNAFTISSDGAVQMISPLDREKNENVEFEIIAKDSGIPQLSSTATVSVFVLDVNDNDPVFDPYNVNYTVSENASFGFLITTFHATDADSNDFGTVFYSLSQNVDGSFTIDRNSGKLTVAKELDREKTPIYTFQVIASNSKNSPKDSNHAISVPITIYIGDVDDNPPVFQTTVPENPVVWESASTNEIVARVIAKDADDVNTDNGRVIYSLTEKTNASQNGSPFFTINSTSGEITPRVSLKGHAGIYFITVRATNNYETHEAMKEINITVVDVNDNYPIFIKPNIDYAVAYVVENSEEGTYVFTLEAFDGDTGQNGEIYYSILPFPNSYRDGSKTFKVDDRSGIITTKADINAEKQDKYELKVQASDRGFPMPFTTNLTMNIIVIDKNDHEPEFSGYSVPYRISIEENKETCTNVSLAIDRDLNNTFTPICYYLVGSSLMDAFIMKTQAGMLCLNHTLDREATPFVNIVIQADEDCYKSDVKLERIYPLGAGEIYPPMFRPTYTNMLWIEIQVEDVNDNPPRFYSKDLALGVTRVTQFGKFIVDLKNDVEDLDSARWGIDYFVATSNFTAYPEALRKEVQDMGVVEPFKLFNNGSVKTNMYFRSQMSGFFTVDVMVFDKGGQSDTAKLRISLINDDQRLIIVFRRPVENVGPVKDEIAKRIGSKIGCRIVVDSIQTHEMEQGQADLAKTDMFIHGEDLETNEIIPAARLLSKFDQNSALLIDVLNNYNILQIIPTRKDNQENETEERLKMALILVSVILGTLCIILCIILYSIHSRYKRKLKAAKALAYVNSGVEPDDLYKTNIPGANIQSYEKPRLFEGQTRF